MTFFFGRVGILDVEVVDGPVQAVADGLGIAGLQAQQLGASAQPGNLVFHQLTLLVLRNASDRIAQLADLVLQRGGLFVQVFSLVPMRLGLGFSALLLGLEINLPCAFALLPLSKVILFFTPPGFLGGELFEANGLGLGVALLPLRVGMFVEPNGFGGLALGENRVD